MLPAEVDGTAAKVQVSSEKGTPISFGVAKGKQIATSTFDVQKTYRPPNLKEILEQSPRKSREPKNHK